MRILVVGAGALGGYYGGRLLSAGRDVTFLVRSKRAEALATGGLSIRSKHGNLLLSAPPTVTASQLNEQFDIILLSCKAYDLDEAIHSFAPAVGTNTIIIPLLNGMRHIDVLNARFGADRIFGGQSLISATLSDQGEVIHLSEFHTLSFGEQNAQKSSRLSAVAGVLQCAGFEAQASDNILLDMWEKWVLVATGAGASCLMRSSIGDLIAAGGRNFILKLFDECKSVATHAGYELRPHYVEKTRAMFTAADSPLTSSMLRDIERGARTEGEQILGDLLARGAPDAALIYLNTSFLHVKSYETRKRRAERLD
ncbi:ketopantoate reductase family protein (plasmid) [Agrobacterium leguminum]|uniref:ketopantoate reductase family protein n=1 Tax=Agrobacterium leguminum TaxID=2792015 RepID=UPI0030D4E506